MATPSGFSCECGQRPETEANSNVGSGSGVIALFRGAVAVGLWLVCSRRAWTRILARLHPTDVYTG